MMQRSLGLQWKLTAIFLAITILGAAAVAAGFYGGQVLGLTPTASLAVGIAAAVCIGLAGTALGTAVARSMKLRLWEASDLAVRIARGDFSTRLPVGNQDEIGILEEQLNRMAEQLEQAVTELQQLAEQNRKLAEEAGAGAALAERAKLARELHDTVNQQLFVLAMRTAAARKRLAKLGGEAEALLPELSELEELARQAHGEARNLIMQLRPTTLEQQGLGPALAEYVKAQGGKEGWEIIDEIDTGIRTGGTVGSNLFRVAQEALNNISKHARARTVWVTLSRTEAGLILKVRDDGEGFDMKAGVRPTAVGLAGMQERVQQMGGTLKVRSAPGEGTEVTATIPLPEGGIPRDPTDAGR